MICRASIRNRRRPSLRHVPLMGTPKAAAPKPAVNPVSQVNPVTPPKGARE